MSRKVLILEDEEDRVRRFRAVLAEQNASLEIVLWKNAHEMIGDLPAMLPNAVFISLDHDLYTEDGSDPGDGLDVARFLAEQKPVCPVIIHSSNSPRAQRMTGTLELENWQVARSVPLGENWIEEDWRFVVSEIMAEGDTTASSNEWSERHRRIVRGLIDCRSPSGDPVVDELVFRFDALPVFEDLFSWWLLTDDGRVVITDGTSDEQRTDFLARMTVITFGAKKFSPLKSLIPERPRGAPDCDCAGQEIFEKVCCGTCGGLGWLFPDAHGELGHG